jgi:cobalt-zinc-cadmium efflux system membrane fusion protein
MFTRRFRKTGLLAIAGLVLFAGAYWAQAQRRPTSAAASPSAAEPPAPKTEVVLTADKLRAARLHLATVEVQRLQELRTVPGKINYRSIRRVDLKAPVDSTVQEVLVKPGNLVQPGDRLAVLDSPEVGLARAEVERNRADVATARQAYDWARQIADNLEKLLKFLNDHPAPQTVERVFEKQLLGENRQIIIAAYSKHQLAEELWEDLQPLLEKGSVSTQLAKQRESNREVAKAEFLAACEQSRFTTRQQQQKTKTAWEYAQRMLNVSHERLRIMLGAYSTIVETPEDASVPPEQLTRFYAIAPFEGKVEQRLVSTAQRVSAGALLFIIANTETLELHAEIREREWQALALQEGDPLTFQVPALSNREFTAKVDYMGQSVSDDTQAVPLVALVANRDRLLRPGMFAWVSLPMGSRTEALAVPASAIMTHDGQPFVFVVEADNRFRRVDITPGKSTTKWVAVGTGLKAGVKVVDQGAFLLKSELLLEPEDE